MLHSRQGIYPLLHLYPEPSSLTPWSQVSHPAQAHFPVEVNQLIKLKSNQAYYEYSNVRKFLKVPSPYLITSQSSVHGHMPPSCRGLCSASVLTF